MGGVSHWLGKPEKDCDVGGGLQRLPEHRSELMQQLSTWLEQLRQMSGLPKPGLARGGESSDHPAEPQTTCMWKDECETLPL